MAWRKSTGRRRGGPKRFKKWSRKTRAKRYSTNTQYVKLRQYIPISTNGSGVTTGYVSYNALNGATNWGNYAAMYDLYRTKGIKLQWFPIFSTAQASLAPAGQDATMVLITDKDSTGVALSGMSMATALGYDNFKAVRVLRQWKYYHKVPAYTQSLNATTSQLTGYLDVDQVANNTVGVVFFTSDATINASTLIGHLVVTAYVEFKNKI